MSHGSGKRVQLGKKLLPSIAIVNRHRPHEVVPDPNARILTAVCPVCARGRWSWVVRGTGYPLLGLLIEKSDGHPAFVVILDSMNAMFSQYNHQPLNQPSGQRGLPPCIFQQLTRASQLRPSLLYFDVDTRSRSVIPPERGICCQDGASHKDMAYDKDTAVRPAPVLGGGLIPARALNGQGRRRRADRVLQKCRRQAQNHLRRSQTRAAELLESRVDASGLEQRSQKPCPAGVERQMNLGPLECKGRLWICAHTPVTVKREVPAERIPASPRIAGPVW